MIDVVKQIKDNKAKKIKRYPCDAIRASSIGYFMESLGGCARRGAYEITHWQEKQLIDVSLQLIFDEGRAQEKTILKDLADADIEIIEQQSPAEFTEYKKPFARAYPIRGHIDGKILEGDGGTGAHRNKILFSVCVHPLVDLRGNEKKPLPLDSWLLRTDAIIFISAQSGIRDHFI